MAKSPMVHLIPSQEAKLVGGGNNPPSRQYLYTTTVQSSSNSTLEGGGEKGLEVTRSSTIISNGDDSKTSTVYSTTTVSTDNTVHRVEAVEHPADKNVHIAIEQLDCCIDLEESIEITRQSSPVPPKMESIATFVPVKAEEKANDVQNSTAKTIDTKDDDASMSTAVSSLATASASQEKPVTKTRKQKKQHHRGIFGLSMAKIRGGKARSSLKSIDEDKPTMSKKVAVMHDNAIELHDHSDDNEETTSVCTGTSFTTRESSLQCNFASMKKQAKPLITAISVSQTDGETFEVVSGDVSSSLVVSPTQAMASRTSSRLSTVSSKEQEPHDAEEAATVASSALPLENIDALALAATKRVASFSTKSSQRSARNVPRSHDSRKIVASTNEEESIENPYENEMFDILKTASSYSSTGAYEGGAVAIMPEINKPPKKIEVDSIDNAVELRRFPTLIKETPTDDATDDDVSLNQLNNITVKSLEDTFELVRDKSFGRPLLQDEVASVHSSLAVTTIASAAALKAVVMNDQNLDAVELLRSQSELSMVQKIEAQSVMPPAAVTPPPAKKQMKVSFQDEEEEIGLVRVGSTACPVVIAKESSDAATIDAAEAESSVEVGRPDSSSSLFSRNAPKTEEAPIEGEVLQESKVTVMAHTGSFTNSIRSGASSKRSMKLLNAVPIDEAENKPMKILESQQTTESTSEAVGTILVDPKPESISRSASLESKSSKASKQLSVDTPESAFFQEETPKPDKKSAPASSTPSSLVESEQNQSIPKLAAPKKDTTPKQDTKSLHAIGAMLEQSLRTSSKMKEEIQETRSSSSNESTASPIPASNRMKVVADNQKGIEVAPSEEFPDPFLCTPEHMVHVNVLGVAGIVVDLGACKSASGDKHCPAVPEKMKVVVGITERGKDKVGAVTSLSKALICSPDGKVGKDKHRHVAVWAANNEGMTPGSLVSSDLVTMERVEPENPKSRYKPRFFDLTIALADDTNKRVGIPIGVAKIKISSDFVNHGEMVSMDLPVYTLQQSQEMKSSAGQQCIKLKPEDAKKKTVRSLFQRQENPNGDYTPTEEEKDALSAAYAIDPTGDSMIRIQVRVETLGISKDEDDEKSFKYEGGKKYNNDDSWIKDDSCDHTEATDPTLNDSIVSSPESPSGDELLVSEKTTEKNESASDNDVLYSRPLETPASPKPQNDSNVANATSMDDGLGFCIPLPTCGPMQDPTRAAQKLDDEIEQVADKLFGQAAPFSKKPRDKGVDTTQETSDADSIYASLSDLGEKLPPVLGPAPTAEEIRTFIKQKFGVCALKSGEFFFPEDPNLVNDDNSSVGSATLEAFVTGQLRMRTMDSTTWRKNPHGGDDDSRTCDTAGSNESEPTIALKPFGESKEAAMTIVQEGKPMDPPATNNGKEAIEQVKETRAVLVETVNDDADDDTNTLGDENDGDDEMSFQSLPRSKRSTGSAGFAASEQANSVAESIVDSLAAALGLHNTCGGVGAAACGDPLHIRNRQMKVPETLEHSDVMSVGDLTAATLEQYHRQMEAAKKAAEKGKATLKNSVNSSNPTTIMQSLFACGNGAADNVDDSVTNAHRSTPIQFANSTEGGDMGGVGQSNSVLSANDDDDDDEDRVTDVTFDTEEHGGRQENYFAEYENNGSMYHATPHSPRRNVASTRPDPLPMDPLSREDPVGNRLTDDEQSVLARSRSQKHTEGMTQPEITKFGEMEWEVDDFDEC